MIIGTCTVTLRISWASSLKEKRMVIKSLMDRMKNKFNVSVAEVDEQDNHKIAVIGFACVTNEVKHADSMLNNILNFIEDNTEAEIQDSFIEIL